MAAADSRKHQMFPVLSPIRAGVSAIVDVCSGSTKRVAAGVGEGAVVVAQIHAFCRAG